MTVEWTCRRCADSLLPLPAARLALASDEGVSAAGAAHIEYSNTLDRAIVQFTGGELRLLPGAAQGRVIEPLGITMSTRRFAALYCTSSQ